MALGIFRHLTLVQVQTLHADAAAALIAGKNRVYSSISANDVTVTKEWAIDNKTFWEELNYALELLSPSSYKTRTRRTVPRYV